MPERLDRHGSVRAVTEVLADLGEVLPRVWLSVDVAAEGLLPRLGLELHRAGEWGNEPDRWLTTGRSDWRPVVERLVHRGWCLAAKAQGLMEWCALDKMYDRRGVFLVYKGLNHVKLTVTDAGGRRQGIRRHDLLPHAGLTHLSHRPSPRGRRDAAAVGRTDRKTLPARRTCLKSDSASPPERCATNTSIVLLTTYRGDWRRTPRPRRIKRCP